MSSIKMDQLARAIEDLQTTCSERMSARVEQRIRDLRAEISTREAEVRRLETLRDDALQSAELVRPATPALAFAFTQRAGILLEEIERARPYALWKKLSEAVQDFEDARSVAAVLAEVNPEVLRGS